MIFLQLPSRRCGIEVVESPERLVLKVRFDKYGNYPDEIMVLQSLSPIFQQYIEDKRPLSLDQRQEPWTPPADAVFKIVSEPATN